MVLMRQLAETPEAIRKRAARAAARQASPSPASSRGDESVPPSALHAERGSVTLERVLETLDRLALANVEMARALRTFADNLGRPADVRTDIRTSENVRKTSGGRPDGHSDVLAAARVENFSHSFSQEDQREESESAGARAADVRTDIRTSENVRKTSGGRPECPDGDIPMVAIPSGTLPVGELVLTLDAELGPECREIALGGIAGRPVKDPEICWRKFVAHYCAQVYPLPLKHVRARWTKWCAQEVAHQDTAAFRDEQRAALRRAEEGAKSNPAESPRAKAEREAREAEQARAEREAAAMTPEQRAEAIAKAQAAIRPKKASGA